MHRRTPHAGYGSARCQARQVAQDDPLGALRAGARPTCSGAASRPSPRVGRGSPALPRNREVPSPVCAPSPGGSTSPSPADVCSRRVIGWQTTCRPVRTDLAPGAQETAVWQRERAGADLTGLVHHLRPRGAVPVPSATGQPWPRPRQSPPWAPGGDSFRPRPSRGTQAPLYKAEPIL